MGLNLFDRVYSDTSRRRIHYASSSVTFRIYYRCLSDGEVLPGYWATMTKHKKVWKCLDCTVTTPYLLTVRYLRTELLVYCLSLSLPSVVLVTLNTFHTVIKYYLPARNYFCRKSTQKFIRQSLKTHLKWQLRKTKE